VTESAEAISEDLLGSEPDGHDDFNRKDISFSKCVCINIAGIRIIVREAKQEPRYGCDDGTNAESVNNPEQERETRPNQIEQNEHETAIDSLHIDKKQNWISSIE
jgi:hypothetical protein